MEEEEKGSESESEWVLSEMEDLAVQSDENESEGSDVDDSGEVNFFFFFF